MKLGKVLTFSLIGLYWFSLNSDHLIIFVMFCRLQVVSTSVGGIPEVLPPDLIYLTEPTVPCKTLLLFRAI